ncbi:hemolymph lipopolysaccharide-binding protein [Anabrus simplex]|uniref:hemolymph lipopolysaccharide-binding protein n=1 Tax=Anabrus simplex TaxID=316456 RepID=UPI0035A2B133
MVLSVTVWLLVLTGSLTTQLSLGPNLQCSCDLPETTVFTVTNQRNETGHWNTEIIARQLECSEDGSTKKIQPSVEARQEKDVGRLSIAAHIAGERSQPGSDYHLVPDHGYYKLHVTGQTWQRARLTCAGEGTHLIILNSEEEAAAIKKLFTQHPKFNSTTSHDSAFAGFHDIYDEEEYLTIFGETLKETGYTHWALGQPDNHGASQVSPGEDCGGVNRQGELVDLNCEEQHAFICEQEICP